MNRKITLCLHALYLMYPLTSYGSEAPHGVDLMDQSSVESKSVDSGPDKASASGGGLIKSDYQPQHKNTIPSSQVEKISNKSEQGMKPISGIMTPKTIPSQNSPKAMSRQSLQDSFKLIRNTKLLDQEEGNLYNQHRRQKISTRNLAHNLKHNRPLHDREDNLKKLQKELQIHDKNKPLPRADQSKVVQEINNANNAHLECIDCLKHEIQGLTLKIIGSYHEDILENDVYVANMRMPYRDLMDIGSAVLKENDQSIGETAQEYVQQLTKYLDEYNRYGIRGGSQFKSMIDGAIHINDMLYPESKPKGVVGAIYDACYQPNPEMTRRIMHWATMASNNIIAFSQKNLQALKNNHTLDELYYNSLKGLSALQQKSKEMNYNTPTFVFLKTEINDIFNQLQIQAQALGLEDNALLAEARHNIMNIGGDKTDQDPCLYQKLARSAHPDVNGFPLDKTYHRNHLQDDTNEVMIKIPHGRKVEIY